MIETTLYSIFGEMPVHRLQKCRILYHLARVVKAPGWIIDVGVWHGYSSIAMAFGSLENNTRRTVYGIDDYFPKHGWAGESYGPDDLEMFREFKAAAQRLAAEKNGDLILPLTLLQGTALGTADLWVKACSQKAALLHWPVVVVRSAILIIGLFFLTFLPLLRGVDSGYSPTTIASSTIPLRANIGDWSEALAWMKENLPRDTVVASWWDYGYWIMVNGEKITLADNGTINSTQIAQIGRMFMSNETQALTILKDYDVDYVTVFTTITLAQQGQLLYGDEVKWRWMAKIGGLDDTAFEDTSITSQIAQAWSMNTQNPSLLNWYERFGQLPIPTTDTVLTTLMIYGAFGILPPEHFQLSFSSSTELVFVYKVLYA